MKRYLSLSITTLAIAAGLSMPASAQPCANVGHAFVLMLGVGY